MENIKDWLPIITVIALAVATFYVSVRKENKQKLSEADAADIKLIGTLKETIEGLDRRLKDSEALANQLKGENNIMRDLLLGRDKDSEDIKRKSITAFTQIAEVHTNVEKLYKVIEQHLKVLSEK